MNAVIGVLGGSGGVGASSFAAVLAAVAGRSLLIDLDVSGGGIDVALGVENLPGVRWSGLRLGGGRLDAEELLARLPRWGPVSVLPADVSEIDPAAVLQVLDVAPGSAPVVVDLPRAGCPERAAALLHCDLVVVLARADVTGLVAAHAVAVALPELAAGVVVRRGAVPARQAAELVGRPLLGELPALGGAGIELRADRPPRAAARVAAGVLAGLPGARLADRVA
jgi:MinD-like ATPase involved in chromosome partitioning or flagellar assembly